MYILGINAHHAGSSACLIHDGNLVAAVEEERFRRVKYWAGFPKMAIEYCLREAGIGPTDLAHVGISRNPSANMLRKVIFTLSQRPSWQFIKERLTNAANVSDPKASLANALGLDPASLKAEFHNIEHHRAHMASAFFVSPFPEAAVLSVDGAGDFVSTMWGVGRDNKIEVQGEINYPHSLGFIYTATSQWLGFPGYGDEGKVMGLASYGRPVFMNEFRKIVRLENDGTFELDLDYFIHHAEGASMTFDEGTPKIGIMYSQKFVDVFGQPRRPRSEITRHHEDVAASLQAVLEEAEFGLVRRLQEKTGLKALCMAGGVALNSAFNGKVLPTTKFEEIYIQPSANDAGTALGVCYYIYHQFLGRPRGYVMTSSSTGPQFMNGSIAATLEQSGLAYESMDDEEITSRTAALIAEGKIVGWFQGRMEWGPRALGNRSILADPRRDDMKAILNARIKHREAFRPFAPSVLLEYAGDYFDQSYPDPFMLKIYGVRKEKTLEIPAVTHVDGTARLQTVDRDTNPLYWRLIRDFQALTGVPILLNTSFNENEPIVCTPIEAIECFQRTRMDALVVGNYIVQRR